MTDLKDQTEKIALEVTPAEPETTEVVAVEDESLASMVTRFAFKQADQAKWQHSNKTYLAGEELQNAWAWFYERAQINLDLIEQTPEADRFILQEELEKAVLSLEQAMENYTSTIHDAKYELNLKLAELAAGAAPAERIVETQIIEAVSSEDAPVL